MRDGITLTKVKQKRLLIIQILFSQILKLMCSLLSNRTQTGFILAFKFLIIIDIGFIFHIKEQSCSLLLQFGKMVFIFTERILNVLPNW